MNNLGLENFKRKFEEQEMWGDEYVFGLEAMNWKHAVAGAGIIGIILAILAKFLGNSGGSSGASAASSPEVKTAVEDTPKVVHALTDVIKTVADEIIAGTSPILEEPPKPASEADMAKVAELGATLASATGQRGNADKRKVNESASLSKIADVVVPKEQRTKIDEMTANEFAKWLKSSDLGLLLTGDFSSAIRLNAVVSPKEYNVAGIEKFSTKLKDTTPILTEAVAALPEYIKTGEATGVIEKEVAVPDPESELKLIEALDEKDVKDIPQLRDYLRKAFSRMEAGDNTVMLDVEKMPSILQQFRIIADNIEKFRRTSSKLPDELKKVGDLLNDPNVKPHVKAQVTRYLHTTSILVASASGTDGSIGHWCTGYVAYHKKLSNILKDLETKAKKKK